MKKHNFILSLLSVLLFSCGEPSQMAGNNIVMERIPVELNEADIFKGNLIMAYLDNDTKFIAEATKLYLKGVNAYRNEKKLDSASTYFRESILKEPSAKAYFELGNVAMDQKDFTTALSAYGVAEQLDYEPFSKILYNKACIYSIQDKKELAGQYLEYSIQAGYTNLDHISKDSDLENLRKTYHYERAVKKGLRGMSNSENLFWLQFIKLFGLTNTPMDLNYELSLAENEALNYISYDYEKYISEMRDEKFSREVSKGFYYYARPYETDDFVVVVYIMKNEFMEDAAPLTYVLATFTHEGKLIDKRIVAGRESLSDDLVEASLNTDLTIERRTLKAEYESDPDENGYYNNKIVSTKEIGKSFLKINPQGKIEDFDSELTSEN